MPLGKSGARFGKAMNQLGWHWWPSDTTIATTDYEGRARCINLGHCTPGCAQGAKASTDITYWPLAIRAGVELRTRCRVREITVDEHGMASGAIYYDAEGNEHFQPAEVVILACNGVGTPRLMLNSVSAQFPNGLANSTGLVGKNLMFHPYALTYGYVDEPLDGNRGPPLCLWSQQFYETDPSRDFVRGYTFQFGRGVGAIIEAIVSADAGRLPWGEDHHAAYRKLRQPPHRPVGDLRGPSRRAQPRHARSRAEGFQRHPRAEDRLHDQRQQPADDGARHRAGEGGARPPPAPRNICVESPILNGGWHLLGTARMGTDPERSVVNEWGRCHDVKNLFIVDGSIWVTSGGVNPTSTIQALALYIADSIKQRLANLFD